MTNDDPWSSIDSPPSGSSRINARRVTPKTPWDLYWAVDSDRNILLILQHGAGVVPRHLPKFRGLRVEAQPADSGTDKRVVIRLTDREQRDIFLRFCRDIVESTALAKTEEQAVARFLERTRRWHKLLQGYRDNRLSDEEQKGLIGELVVLERHLLPVLGTLDAVRCWTGPLDTPRDFEIAQIQIEAKTRGQAVPRVIISSEHQLASLGADRLFLHVTKVSIAPENASGAVTVTNMASRVRSLLIERDTAAVDPFESRLDTIGFDWKDDYSNKSWLIGDESVYEVCEGFPRITPATIPGGVGDVRYTLSLPDCEAFRVDPTALADAISGATNDS